MSKQQFYKDKYANFQKFCKENAAGNLAPLCAEYANVSYDTFMVAVIKNYIRPNIKKLDELIEKELLEHDIYDVLEEVVDKFRRYLQLFNTYFD